MVQELLERFPEATGTAQTSQLAAVARFLGVNADLRRLRRSIGAGIAAYDPATASSPRGVFCVVRLLLISCVTCNSCRFASLVLRCAMLSRGDDQNMGQAFFRLTGYLGRLSKPFVGQAL